MREGVRERIERETDTHVHMHRHTHMRERHRDTEIQRHTEREWFKDRET